MSKQHYTFGTFYTFKKHYNKDAVIARLVSRTKRQVRNYLRIKDYKSTYYSDMQQVWACYSPYIRTLFVRGIGYRLLLFEHKDDSTLEEKRLAGRYLKTLSQYSKDGIIMYGDTVIPKDIITNRPVMRYKNFYDRFYDDLNDKDEAMFDYRECYDVQAPKYLIVRVGDTVDKMIPLSRFVDIKTHRKERKITIYGTNKVEVRNLAKIVYDCRRPSPYTGRGVKVKRIKVRYKKVRRTKAGGRAF